MNIIIVPKRKDKRHHKIIKEAVEFFVSKLMSKRSKDKINNINIKLADSVNYGNNRGDCHEVELDDGKFDIFLRIEASAPLPDIISTIAHEIVHAKQGVKKELVVSDDHSVWTWKGKKYKHKKEWYEDFTIAQQSDKLPWEKEAYEAEKTLARAFFWSHFSKN